ncbi:MAG: DUF1353 domain-containing protein [Chromatiales bacterium]|nr:hypothetical protein [Gammaproteobacteria bacterium]
MTNLYAPDSYYLASDTERALVCNGCGSKGLGGFLVPDTLYGLSVTDACQIHDWMYHAGENVNDKDEADRVFLNNMIRIIDAASSSGPVRWMRRYRAMSYFAAVRDFGGSAYWLEKNAPDKLIAV